MSKEENKKNLKRIFSNALDVSSAIQAILLSTADGHSLAKLFKSEVSDSALAAMSSSCMALGDRIAAEVKQNKCEFVILQNDAGYIVLNKVSPRHVITFLADERVNLGMLLNTVKNTSRELKEVLGDALRG
ncbi:hypothetical protein TDB9533_04341 [Thalassocella blandensis]|nr:hypothetical protein TDB9533_04341 [Thalassocella blandensis]